ncbi:hypothetical protein M9H77_28154 [Catharanthus roseus]|uniref:Uncharacterized protein n=1 Tax=Catharanthus roseus TaxID=4058 RepID=A0ACC0AFJ6_CATRO|nr:hypothetical protein M9H77_28154 [Catharanthus roseus]
MKIQNLFVKTKLFLNLEILKKEKDISKLEFQKLVLENKKLCEKVLSLEKCMVDYNDLKEKKSSYSSSSETLSRDCFKRVKTKNANIGRGEDEKEKKVPSGIRAPDSFISAKEAANFEEWTRNRRKIDVGHRVDLNDMQGMEAIPNLFDAIWWTLLLTVNELYYTEMIYEFYANLHKGRVERVDNIPHQWVLSRIGGRNIAFDDRLLNTILETPQGDMRFYTKNKK